MTANASREMRRAGLWACCVAVLCTLGHAATALAHAAPEILKILWPDSGDGVLLVTNRGLIFGAASGGSWRLMCNEALQVTVTDPLSLTYLEDGRLWVGSHVGLMETRDDGCTWQGVDPLGSVATEAIQRDPSQPSRIYVATYGPGVGGVRVTENGGSSWTMLMPVADNDFLRGLSIAPGKPTQLYALGTTFGAGGNKHYVARSSDRGASWERSDLVLTGEELDPVLFAVSPKDPLLVLAKASAAEPRMTPERLLVSRDGGKSFSSPLSIMSLRDVSFSADGSTLWLVGTDGLWRSSDDAQTFEQVGSAKYMTSITQHSGVLFGGGYYAGLAAQLDGIGTSSDSGDSFKPWMVFKDVTNTSYCAADSATAVTCQMPAIDWEAERSQFGNGSATVGVDAGAASLDSGIADSGAADAGKRRDSGLDAAHDAGDTHAPDAAGTTGPHVMLHGGGCSCSLVGPARSQPSACMWLLAAAIGRRVWRRRRDRRS